jgi:hypothetical protein
MAARDQPSAEIDTSRVTDRHHSPVTVRVAPNACHHTAANLICEGEGSVLATPIGDAVADAVLAAFRSVDAKKPDTLAVDLDRVAVDDVWPMSLFHASQAARAPTFRRLRRI